VEITAAVAADLATLTEALDDADLDLADTVRQLAVDAKLAVRSYLGLTVAITVRGHEVHLVTLELGLTTSSPHYASRRHLRLPTVRCRP
jgi:hypothetical protein